MLISRTASLGKLRHKPQGYTGPLSRHLLSYYSIISSLHGALRDLLEMSLVTMFLGGHIDRERDDWMDLSLGYVKVLGFLGCSFGTGNTHSLQVTAV